MALLGGRSVHPVSVKVGGFSRVPLRRELAALNDELLWARDAALETVRWVAAFEVPDLEMDYNYVALRHPDEYPLNEGQIAAAGGLQISAHELEPTLHRAPSPLFQCSALHLARLTLCGRPAGSTELESRTSDTAGKTGSRRQQHRAALAQSVLWHRRPFDRNSLRARGIPAARRAV